MAVVVEEVKVFAFCSKHRSEKDEIPKYKSGTIIPDKEIECVACGFTKEFVEEE